MRRLRNSSRQPARGAGRFDGRDRSAAWVGCIASIDMPTVCIGCSTPLATVVMSPASTLRQPSDRRGGGHDGPLSRRAVGAPR
jgi:hypothetical protein